MGSMSGKFIFCCLFVHVELHVSAVEQLLLVNARMTCAFWVQLWQFFSVACICSVYRLWFELDLLLLSLHLDFIGLIALMLLWLIKENARMACQGETLLVLIGLLTLSR